MESVVIVDEEKGEKNHEKITNKYLSTTKQSFVSQYSLMNLNFHEEKK